MNVILGTSSFTVNVALTYEDGSVVDLTALDHYALWVRSGRGRYKGAPQLVTDGTDGRVSFTLDAQDLSDKRGNKVSWQFEVKTSGGQVIWTEADSLTLVPRS